MLDNLKQIVEANREIIKPLYLRNLLKEEIQNYILNFVYNDKDYKELIFTGGTCLRKIYNLPRLSEDLDFDYLDDFDINNFAKQVQKYFVSTLQYKKATTRISGTQKTVFIKLPLLEELGLGRRGEVLFVRCDFYYETIGEVGIETNSLSTRDMTFFVRNYDLSTLFANKIMAFLQRDFFRGKEQAIAFKARDVFDLVWFLERSQKSAVEFMPNWLRLSKALDKGRNKIIDEVVEKTQSIDEKQISQDLNAFIESDQSVEAFSQAFKEIITRGFRAFEKR